MFKVFNYLYVIIIFLIIFNKNINNIFMASQFIYEFDQ